MSVSAQVSVSAPESPSVDFCLAFPESGLSAFLACTSLDISPQVGAFIPPFLFTPTAPTGFCLWSTFVTLHSFPHSLDRPASPILAPTPTLKAHQLCSSKSLRVAKHQVLLSLGSAGVMSRPEDPFLVLDKCPLCPKSYWRVIEPSYRPINTQAPVPKTGRKVGALGAKLRSGCGGAAGVFLCPPTCLP